MSGTEKTEILASVNSMAKALVQNDMMELFRVAPDRILAAIAEQANVSVEELLVVVREATETDLSTVTFSAFSFEIDGLDLTDTAHPDGTEITYGILPASFEMEVDGVRFRQDTEYLVLSEGGRWYIIRFAETQQLLLIQEAYPFLSPLNAANTTVIQLPE